MLLASITTIAEANMNRTNHSGELRRYKVQPSAGGSETVLKASTSIEANRPRRKDGHAVTQ